MRKLIINTLQLALTLGAVGGGVFLLGLAMYGGIATAMFLAILAQQISTQDARETMLRSLGHEESGAFSQGLISFSIALWFGATWISSPPLFLYGTWKTRVDHD